MGIFFAAAGLAEAAWAFDLIICWAGLFFIASIIIVACIRKSWKLSLTAVILLLLFSLLFSPWMAFEPIRPDSDGVFDSDVVDWSDGFQKMAYFWCVESVVAIALLPIIFVLEKRRRRKCLDDESQTNIEHSKSLATTIRILIWGFSMAILFAVGSLVLGFFVVSNRQSVSQSVGLSGPTYNAIDGSILSPDIDFHYESVLPCTLSLIDSKGHQLLKHRISAGQWHFAIRVVGGNLVISDKASKQILVRTPASSTPTARLMFDSRQDSEPRGRTTFRLARAKARMQKCSI